MTSTTLSRLSLKKRRLAAQRWAQWRNAGMGEEITCAEAFRLTNDLWYAERDPRLKVRLTSVAIQSVL